MLVPWADGLVLIYIKVSLHGRRQAAQLARDMLQRDLLRGKSIYMVGRCRARLLHIIHVSAVSEVGVLQENCSWQPVPCGNFKFKLKLPPGLAAVARLLRAACRCVNALVVLLCFYFAAPVASCVNAPLCCIPVMVTWLFPGAWFKAPENIQGNFDSSDVTSSLIIYDLYYQILFVFKQTIATTAKPTRQRPQCYKNDMQCGYWIKVINPLWPSDAIWWHRTESTLAHVMACYKPYPVKSSYNIPIFLSRKCSWNCQPFCSGLIWWYVYEEHLFT